MPSALNPTRASRSAAATPMLALLPLSKCVLWRQWSLQFFRTRWQLLQYPWVGRQQNFGYKQEVAAWDDPPSSDSDDNDDDEDDDASTIKIVHRLMR